MAMARMLMGLSTCAALSPPCRLGRSSFVPLSYRSSKPRRNVSPRLTMVFERMSEDCINALVTAQQEASRLGLKQVGTEVVVAGIVDHPEHRAMDRTLAKYGITWRKVQKTLTEMYKETMSSSSSSSSSPASVSLGNFKPSPKKTNDSVPFSKSAKSAMMRAGKLADQMGSTTIQSHHLLLGILEYEEVQGKAVAATLDKDDVCSCGALAVILKLEGFDTTVQAVDICQTLLQQIEQQGVTATDRGELVTGAKEGTSKTPTLEECGIDLTQMARDGLLDPVYGRDKEIQSALRTLVRRRKNNVCLMGEGTAKENGCVFVARLVTRGLGIGLTLLCCMRMDNTKQY
jgi:ATP-dependent Clp protease ATP-binding subunit ClpC